MSAALGRWQIETLTGRRALRLIDPERIHLTLAFLGSRPLSELPAIRAACDALAGFAIGGLALGDPVWLPRRRPNVLAVRVEDDRGELRDAQSLVAGTLVAARVLEPERRAFFPHLTVARVLRGERVRPAAIEPPAALEFEGATVTLHRSRIDGRGARYETLHRVPLAGG